ncbi:uncharacterized protein PITG_10294 [Phytophthora infestans T30-4]|uniref:Uncharacterized protein n=1 Tax=Phytophthora infestans (strain T30-4) TaxID=403677 RepID=D0NEZ9_PHYIT|nr:uncharacterized protein PITG_10294 [Phytophthora infestans T30-4]EEY56788.1 conserved hypothetical protein [Phytophthora infestans T30-4]|eukprot:XP_002902116.1 conserved hypothetical protein [Phytophthora infestans T30-4]
MSPTGSDDTSQQPKSRDVHDTDASSERLERLEVLLEGMARQQAQFMANQAELQKQIERVTNFIKARGRRMKVGSLDTSMRTFVPPINVGLKVPNPRDLDWPSFANFTGKEVYPGLSADFKTWGLRFLQKVVAAQQMSGGDWSEEFRILTLNGKREGTALVYFEMTLPLWMTESPTLEHVMNRMLAPATGRGLNIFST